MSTRKLDQTSPLDLGDVVCIKGMKSLTYTVIAATKFSKAYVGVKKECLEYTVVPNNGLEGYRRYPSFAQTIASRSHFVYLRESTLEELLTHDNKAVRAIGLKKHLPRFEAKSTV